MLVEHTFVTTLEAEAAWSRAEEFLAHLGFRVDSRDSSHLRAVRGRRRPNTWKINQWPQEVRLAFDRGRVNVALGLTSPRNKDTLHQAEYLTALGWGLEHHLSRGLDIGPAAAAYQEVEIRLMRKARRRGWLPVYILAGFLGLVLLICLISLLAALVSKR